MLKDARNVDPVPIEQFWIPQHAHETAQFVKFESNSHYGVGGGVQYLELVTCIGNKIDYTGGNMKDKGIAKDSITECKEECKNTVGCAYFAWATEAKQCYVKNGIEQVVPRPGVVSGTTCFGGKFNYFFG